MQYRRFTSYCRLWSSSFIIIIVWYWSQQPLLITSSSSQTTQRRQTLHKWVSRCISNSSLPTHCKTQWVDYRLADCIRWCVPCYQQRQFDSIAKDYYHRVCNKTTSRQDRSNNLDALSQILASRHEQAGFVQPDPKTLVIHLRLGDIIEQTPVPVEAMLLEGVVPGNSYQGELLIWRIKSISDYRHDIGNATQILLLGGAHQTHCRKSLAYAHCLAKALQQHYNLQVTLQINGGTPDQDFYQLCHAQQLITAAGGYSALVGRMVKRNGGQVSST